MFSSAFQLASLIASQPAAMTSARAVFPYPRAPMTATRPELRGMVGVAAQGAFVISTSAMTCEGIAAREGAGPT